MTKRTTKKRVSAKTKKQIGGNRPAKYSTQAIVKRHGRSEHYDDRKVYASVYAACLCTHMNHHEAELVAERVRKDMSKWIVGRSLVTSQQLFSRIAHTLRVYNRDAGYMYESHRDLS